MGVLIQESSGLHSHSGIQSFCGSAVFSGSVTAIMILAQRKGKWPGGVHEGGFRAQIKVANNLLSPVLYWR